MREGERIGERKGEKRKRGEEMKFKLNFIESQVGKCTIETEDWN